jgi:hypothetical protein
MYASMKRPIGIYQPFFKPALIERLDPGFIPLDWLSNPTPALRELAIHRHIAVNRIYANHRLTGLLSGKFFSKTRLRSQQVYDWISDNPGHEIYLINGLPYVPYANYNLMERSTIHHPGFESWARSVAAEIGLEFPEELPRQTNANLCVCNYWIASAAFWEGFARDVIAPLFELIDRRQGTNEILAHHKYSAPSPVYNLTIIYEKLIDCYVTSKKINALYYPWNAKSVLSLDCYKPSIRSYLETMIPHVERIDAAGSWSDSDKAWLREKYAEVNLGYSADELLVNDPIDFDLPRFYPTASGISPQAG